MLQHANVSLNRRPANIKLHLKILDVMKNTPITAIVQCTFLSIFHFKIKMKEVKWSGVDNAVEHPRPNILI